MDFNGRMSMARSTQVPGGRKQQEPDDAFMMVQWPEAPSYYAKS
jgi:hypothetical protein